MLSNMLSLIESNKHKTPAFSTKPHISYYVPYNALNTNVSCVYSYLKLFNKFCNTQCY
jgi:hypothetical protein